MKKNKWQIITLALLVGVSYLNSLNNAFLSDDIAAVRDNPSLNKFSYLFFNPIFFARALPYYLISKISTQPFLFRLLNISLHFGTVIILYAVLKRLSNQKTAFFASSLVAVHPVLTESVTWISGGIYAQYTFLLLLSFWFYLEAKKNTRFMYPAIVFYIFALSTSEKAVIFPVFLMLYEFSYGMIKEQYKKLLPFFGLTALLGVLYVGRIQYRFQALRDTYYQTGGIDNPLFQIPVAITEYLKLIFFPKDLAFYHSELDVTGVGYLIRLAVFVLFICALFFAYKKNKNIFFWMSAFLITLIPTLTPFRLSWLVAERYVYFGAVCMMAACAFVFDYFAKNKKWTALTYMIFSLLLVLLTGRTIMRNFDWKDQDHLWLATARTSPSSPQNHNNLGDLYARRGDFQKAAQEFKVAISLNPNYADVYHNLANTYQDMKQYGKALENYKKAYTINPSLWQSHQNRGAVFFNLKKYAAAEEEFKKAVLLFPQNPTLHTNLGIIYLFQNKKEEAKREFIIALQINPSDTRASAGIAELDKKENL